jgi:hypothetical protein
MKTKKVEVTLGVMVPEWVAYVAQDFDGDWFGWERKPIKDRDSTRWVDGGDMIHISLGHENIKWWTTLRAV